MLAGPKGLPGFQFFSIAMGADYSFYVESIATCAPTFFGLFILVLASLAEDTNFGEPIIDGII